MSDFSFGTKAETLKILYENQDTLQLSVLRPFFFTVKEWEDDCDAVLIHIFKDFKGFKKLIVRSSAKSEDSESESLAGKYESIISFNDENSLKTTINKVIDSYGNLNPMDQVLVQEAIEDVDCSGVVFTKDPNSGGNYFVVNYDDKTGSTSSITSGTGKDTKLFYWFSKENVYPDDVTLRAVCKAASNLVKFTKHNALDIEFLFSKEKLYILQTRPLVLKRALADESMQKNVLNRLEAFIAYQNKNKPFLFGRRTIYGVMPDWNPAEMIGIHPHNLALSLYKEVITDEVWAYQRDNYGYKRLRSFPLMLDFCGYPYIDVRVSFNSFIPADLDSEIADKLVNYYLDRLEESPDKHDKVEFDIVFSCYTFDLKKRIKVLLEYGFTEIEIKKIVDSLRNLTRKISDNENGLWKKDSAKLTTLETRRNEIEKSDLKDMDKAFWLLEDCKRYGTLPFAGLARAGFIAVQLLKSMVSEGIITEAEKDLFMNDLNTVGSSMKSDYSSMGKQDFLTKYGFLRPGTYDICSLRYDEAPDTYFSWTSNDKKVDKSNENFRLSLTQMKKIKQALIDHGMGEDVLGLFSFIKGAIEGREHAKFVFTRNISDILKYLGNWGETLGFERSEISYADIGVVKELYAGVVDDNDILKRSISEGKAAYKEGLGVVLPPLITKETEIKSFFVPKSQPNYITQKRIQGKLLKIDKNVSVDEIDGKILMIESADPGYDWIFSHKILGFITKWGGANSHMAIRAGELDLPAVVGAGERLFSNLLDAEIVEIDSPKKQVNVIR